MHFNSYEMAATEAKFFKKTRKAMLKWALQTRTICIAKIAKIISNRKKYF